MLLPSPSLVHTSQTVWFFISHLCFFYLSPILGPEWKLRVSFSKWLPDEQGQIFLSLMLDCHFSTSTHASEVCTSVCFPGFCWISADVFRSAGVKCTSHSYFSHITQSILRASSFVSDCSTVSEHQMAWDPYYALPQPKILGLWVRSEPESLQRGKPHPGVWESVILSSWLKMLKERTQLSLESVSVDLLPILNRSHKTCPS